MTFIFKLIWCFRVDFLETNKRIQLWLTGEEPWYLGGQYNKHTSAGLQPSSGLFLQPFSKELPKPDSFTHTHTPVPGCHSSTRLSQWSAVNRWFGTLTATTYRGPVSAAQRRQHKKTRFHTCPHSHTAGTFHFTDGLAHKRSHKKQK